MDVKFFIVCFALIAVIKGQEDESVEIENVQVDPNILDLLSPSLRPSVLENFKDTNIDSYAEETKNIGASLSFTKTKPPIGVGVSLLKPQIEVLRLIEDFVKLKAELVTRVYALINENYDLIKGVVNLLFSKLTHLQAFSLKGISVIRKIIDFALTLFSSWNVGVSASVPVNVPHEVYGVPIY